MPKPRTRVCLQHGLKLEINRLARRGFILPGSRTGPTWIQWTDSYTGEVTAGGTITASMEGNFEGWFALQLGDLQQSIELRANRRHFGGRQWYFVCPRTNRLVSVLWRPPGARQFASRQFWGRQVAYASQFETASDRAWRGKAKVKARLIADLDPEEWDFPPKPKWMRWGTYKQLAERFDVYDDMTYPADDTKLIARLIKRYG